MRLSAYRNFYRSVQRLRSLYDATVHSYRLLYENGRKELKGWQKQGKKPSKKVQLIVDERKVARPLDLITYHARDVYPELLRSTLLVRLVAAYEAFLVDVVEEISWRSSAPFMNSNRVEFSAEQLLTINADEGIYRYLVSQNVRRLTGGGLKEIRRFYEKSFGCDISPTASDISAIEEIHERRHLFVHRAGYVDRVYETKYPHLGFQEGDLIQVTDTYLGDAFSLLDKSAMSVKVELEQKYPPKPIPVFTKGEVKLDNLPENLQFVEFEPVTSDARAKYSDLSFEIRRGRPLRAIVAWMSKDDKSLRFVISGAGKDIRSVALTLRNGIRDGEIRNVVRFKIGRSSSQEPPDPT